MWYPHDRKQPTATTVLNADFEFLGFSLRFLQPSQIMDQIPGWFAPYGQVMSVRMVRDFR